jgi:hypothetical protein
MTGHLPPFLYLLPPVSSFLDLVAVAALRRRMQYSAAALKNPCLACSCSLAWSAGKCFFQGHEPKNRNNRVFKCFFAFLNVFFI